LSTGLSETGVRGLESRQKLGEMSDFCLPDSPKSGRGSESRQKPGEMSDFCLPDSPNPGRAVSKVEQNHPKLKKYSTAASKFRVRDIESRTKSSKIEKMFYRCLQIQGARNQK